MFLPLHLVHDFGDCRTVLPLEHGDYLGGLAAFARPVSFLRLGGLFGFGRILGRVVFFPDFALAGATLAACAPRLPFFSAFGFVDSVSGFAVSASG
jgi:hypothetical protein